MKSIAVVGATGFIGQEITSRFRSSNWEVYEYSRHHVSENSRLNLLDESTWEAVFESGIPDIVLSTAWHTEHASFWSSSLNVDYSIATSKFAKYCMERKIKKFVALGSMSEYGSTNSLVAKEVEVKELSDLYSRKKIDTFKELLMLSNYYHVPVQWLRIFQAFGPKEKKDRLLPSLLSSLRKSESFILLTPLNILDWIDVRDIASAVLWSVTKLDDSLIDIGTGIPTSVAEISALVCEVHGFGTNLIEFGPQPLNTVKNLVVNKNSPLLKSGWLSDASLRDRLIAL